jgi:sulfite oxidase
MDIPFELRRRHFLAGGAGTLTTAAIGGWSGVAMAQGPTADQIIPGKSAEMIIHNAKLGVMETPLTLLRKYPHTPKEILFCRFHYPHEGDAAWYGSLQPPKREDWVLEVGGLVARSRRVKLTDLEHMPLVKRVSVIQCAGNGRSFYAAKQKVGGGQWKNGGMGNVEWEGVPLRQFLEDQKVLPAASARYLTAEGWDQPATPEGSDFAKSYLLEDAALDHAILALRMNGEPIPAAHGGPLRLIIPGYYGNMNVKLLTQLNYMDQESPSVFQSLGYRFPDHPVEPGTFGANDYNHDNSRPTYAHQIKSVIFSPLPEDRPGSGNVMISGVAFNDGTAPITRVAVSADGGKHWQDAAIKPAESPWAWYHWQLEARLAPGENVLMSLATDALGRSQPLDGLTRWNPRGYEWNGADRVAIVV